MWRKILCHFLCRIKRISCLSMRRAFFKQHLPYSFPAASQDWDQMGENSFHPLNRWYPLSTEGLHHQPPHTNTAGRAWQQESEAAKKVHPPPTHTHTQREGRIAEQKEVTGEVCFCTTEQQELLGAKVTAAIKNKNNQHLLIRCAAASEMCLQ